MASGISIHIGVNYLNDQRRVSAPPLPNCENDAMAMQAIADENGFESVLIKTEDATCSTIKYLLNMAADALGKNDILFLTYSGHGGYQKDENNDEGEDYEDETWLLYDRMLVDDELAEAWARFNEGTRIIVVSDSCHSGTITKAPKPVSQGKQNDKKEKGRFSFLSNYKNKVYPSERKKEVGNIDIKSSVLLIAACSDNETTRSWGPNGEPYSEFTYHLVKTWTGKQFSGNYKDLHKLLYNKLIPQQHVCYYTIGRQHPYFENQKPFTI